MRQPTYVGWLADSGAELAGSLLVEPLEAAGDSNSGGVEAGVAVTDDGCADAGAQSEVLVEFVITREESVPGEVGDVAKLGPG